MTIHRLLLLNILWFIAFPVVTAQTQVTLHIHHKLGQETFSLNTPASNNLGDTYEISRLAYYLSGISLIHDQGQVTTLDSTWLLVDAAVPESYVLGTFNIQHLEGFHFHIGVDSAHNHLDPALWEAGHPLAPQWPSMHWGWVSGYRFVALEGNGGPQYNQSIQLHGLGDQNYFKARVLLDEFASNGTINIDIDADYTRALENIPVNSGIIVHGETLEARTCLENFKNLVFSPTSPTTAVNEIGAVPSFLFFPNPTSDRQLTISTGHYNAADITPSLFTADMKSIPASWYNTGNHLRMSLPAPGLYFITLYVKGQPLSTHKIVSL